jgi:hypothetical protein
MRSEIKVKGVPLSLNSAMEGSVQEYGRQKEGSLVDKKTPLDLEGYPP